MNIEPKSKYTFIFAKDEEGNEIKYRFMLILGVTLKSVEAAFVKNIIPIPGIDAINASVGRYTAEIVIARTFDAEEVVAELKTRLERDVLNTIVTPGLIVP